MVNESQFEVLLRALSSPDGVIAILVIILIAGTRGYWVYGRHYEDCRREREEWRRIAMPRQFKDTEEGSRPAPLDAPDDPG